nr:hypothetical protein [Tanacetum cinerariifolium]
MNQNCYNSYGFDQIQPPQYPVMSEEIFQAKENLMKSIQTFLKKFNRITFREMPKVLSQDWEKFFKIQHAQPEDTHELLRKLFEDLQIISKELAEYINSPSWNRRAFYDNDDDYSIQYKEYLENSSNAIAPVLPTEEPEYSLSMGDEHLSTIPETESDELIKSSVENLVPIQSESKVASDNESEYDVPVCDDFTTISNPLFDCNDDFTSSDDKSLSNGDVLMENFKIEEIELFLDMDDWMPPGDDYDSEEDIHFIKELLSNDTLPLPENESSSFDHHDDLLFSCPHPKPPDVEIFFDFEPDTTIFHQSRVEKKLSVIEQPISSAPPADSTANYNMHNMGKTISELHALLIEYEKCLSKKAATLQVMAIQGGRIQKANKKSLNAKGKGKEKGKGKDKPEVGHWKMHCPAYLAELIKKKKQVGTVNSLGLRGERMLKQGALYLCVGNGVHAKVKAIGSDDLVLPNSIVICLDNCHYAPTITRGYPKETIGYYFYFLPENKIDIVRYAEFLQKNLISLEVSERAKELKEIQDKDTSPFENTNEILIEVEGFELPYEKVVPIRRVDYEETFSPVADIKAIMILIDIAVTPLFVKKTLCHNLGVSSKHS